MKNGQTFSGKQQINFSEEIMTACFPEYEIIITLTLNRAGLMNESQLKDNNF